MKDFLREPWWRRILMGDTTAIPAEWEIGDGKLDLSGEREQADAFIAFIEQHNIKPKGELARACAEYARTKGEQAYEKEHHSDM